jgi:hypothetical protein
MDKRPFVHMNSRESLRKRMAIKGESKMVKAGEEAGRREESE